jgi:hypothetical protein
MAEHKHDSADEAMQDASADTLKTPDADEPAPEAGERAPGGAPAPEEAADEPMSDASADTLKDPRADET